jgi:abortive infection bacteriophage resistance protein
MKYTKPALTFAQQADQLIARGLLADRDLLIDRLRAVSYYRLSGYWFTYRALDPMNPKHHLDTFQPDTHFDMIWNRYVFDRHLRLLVMDAIERIEVAARTAIAYHHSQNHGPFGYATDPTSLPSISKKDRDLLLGSVQREKNRSKERFVGHFQSRYGSHHSDLPIWMAIEIMSFGSVLTLYRGCSPSIRKTVAGPVDVHDAVFESWLLTLNTVRNICAHHGRLWNREIGTKPKIPNKDRNWHTPVEVGNRRMFGVLTICKWTLDRIAPQSRWANRLRTLLLEYPDIPLVSMGFPDNWQASAIWRAAANISDKVVAKAKRTEGAD